MLNPFCYCWNHLVLMGVYYAQWYFWKSRRCSSSRLDVCTYFLATDVWRQGAHLGYGGEREKNCTWLFLSFWGCSELEVFLCGYMSGWLCSVLQSPPLPLTKCQKFCFTEKPQHCRGLKPATRQEKSSLPSSSPGLWPWLSIRAIIWSLCVSMYFHTWNS